MEHIIYMMYLRNNRVERVINLQQAESFRTGPHDHIQHALVHLQKNVMILISPYTILDSILPWDLLKM